MREVVGLARDVLRAVWRRAQEDGGVGGLVVGGFLLIHLGMWAVLAWVVVPVALLRWVLRW